MTTSTSQLFESYVPVYDAVPEKWEDARAFLTEEMKKIANAVNIREIGWMLANQNLNGQQFIPSTGDNFRSVFRIVIDCGALPNATTKSVAHGLTVDANFSLIHLYGAATKATATFASLPLPYASPTLNENIKINLDATNVNITTAIDYSAYTKTYATIEFLLEA